MRISDWSSDVWSSDLSPGRAPRPKALSDGQRKGGRSPLSLFGDRRHRLRRCVGIILVHLHDPAADMAARPAVEEIDEQADRGPDQEEDDARSEEHTSELQSLMRISYAVFCLKKKNTKIYTQNRQYETATYN